MALKAMALVVLIENMVLMLYGNMACLETKYSTRPHLVLYLSLAHSFMPYFPYSTRGNAHMYIYIIKQGK